MNWHREDILEVLSWVEDAADDVNSITTELEFIVVSELFKRCADEIRNLRAEVAELKRKKTRRRKI
jgi:hypothetical protein